MPKWTITAGPYELCLGERPLVMGIINLTPDSLSRDGLSVNLDAAMRQAAQFMEDGADLLDIDGEFARPGSTPVTAEEELRRIIPAIEAIADMIPLPVSVDTSKAEVARRALQGGACLINDIWGFRADPDMAEVAAEFSAPVVLMHNRENASYHDLINEIKADLEESMKIADRAGVSREKLILDPGISFGKNASHNLMVLRRLPEFKTLGRPLLLGTSRKSFIGHALGLPVGDRLMGTAATVAWGIAQGADIVRVHEVKEMSLVVKMTEAILHAKEEAEIEIG